MTNGSPPLTRRRWRDEHKPLVRHWRHGFFHRTDPVFAIASWIFPTTGGAILAAAFGGRGRFRVSTDDSSVAMAVCAVVMGLALAAVSLRLIINPGYAPLSVGGTIFVVCVSASSVTILVARAEGHLSAAIWHLFAAMGGCAIIAAVTLVLSYLRSPDRHPLTEDL